MNFLAHFLLAENHPASRVGNFLGDFLRGRPTHLLRQHPPALVRGICQHRQVDSFTDHHPLFRSLRPLLAPSRQRLAGIVIDLFFDHLLARHWSRFAQVPLPSFVADCLTDLESHPHWLPVTIRDLPTRARWQQWLPEREDWALLDQTLRRVSQRRTFLAPIAEASEDLKTHFEAFERAFLEFFPELMQANERWLKEHSLDHPLFQPPPR